MHRNAALTIRRQLVAFALVGLTVTSTIAAEPRWVEASETYPVYTGDEFTDLFDGLDLPGTDPVGAPPSITGDSDADARIRSIAEGRGYQLRPELIADPEWVGGEA